jgi:hypothetical protein
MAFAVVSKNMKVETQMCTFIRKRIENYVTVCRLSPGNPRKILAGQKVFLLPVCESTTEQQMIAEKETKNPEHVDTLGFSVSPHTLLLFSSLYLFSVRKFLCHSRKNTQKASVNIQKV